MNFIVLIVCLVAVIGRRRRGASTAVPSIIGGFALLASISAVAGLARSFDAVALANPSDRPTIIAAWISETINSVVVALVVEIPLLAGAYFLDRWLCKRQTPRLEIEAAPAGSVCANHPARGAILICLRCGAFACNGCSAQDRKHCRSCFERPTQPSVS